MSAHGVNVRHAEIKRLLAALRCQVTGHGRLEDLRGLWSQGFARCVRCDELVNRDDL